MIISCQKIISCHECGKSIIFKGGNHKYCDTCSKERTKDAMNIARMKYLQKPRDILLNPKNDIIICHECGKSIPFQGRNHKYCDTCTEELRKENVRVAMMEYRSKWKDMLPQGLGSGWLSQRPRSDFNDEYQSVKREVKRLGLNTF